MGRPDFESARRYALDRLQRELDPRLVYHSVAHTAEDVVPAAERLAGLSEVCDMDLLLLRTAAYFHDLGFLELRQGHEQAGVRIAADVLPQWGYAPDQIELISGMIMATRLPQSPRSLLEQLMADADLDVLGREDFMPKNALLRAELEAYGEKVNDREWLKNQLVFVQAHQYCSAAAKRLRDAGKQRNLETLRELLMKLPE